MFGKQSNNMRNNINDNIDASQTSDIPTKLFYLPNVSQ